MTPSFRHILEVLNNHKVEYIVVGGVAAMIHGAPMTTFEPVRCYKPHVDSRTLRAYPGYNE